MSKKNKKQEAADAVTESQEALAQTDTETSRVSGEEVNQSVEPKDESRAEEDAKANKDYQQRGEALQGQLKQVLAPFLGKQLDASSSTSIKNCIYNIVGDGTPFTINRDGSIDVTTDFGTFKIK